MSYFLFLLVNATLFIRPAEIVPELLGLPIYEVLILSCLVATHASVFDHLKTRSILSNPITVCVLGLLVAVVVSHLVQLSSDSIWYARHTGLEFLKMVLYYLLVVSLITSTARLRSFLSWFVAFTIVLTILAVLQFHGIIAIPTLEALERTEFDPNLGIVVAFLQLRSTGIFNDPNDLSLVLVLAMGATLYWRADRGAGLMRYVWLLPLGLFGYAFALTRSRGGFIAMLAGVLCLLQGRYGWKRTLPLALVAVPLLFAVFAGRQTDISTNAGTAQGRIQLWSEGLGLFRLSPIFGIGYGNYGQYAGQVAHNSFIHCFAELGFFGGVLFLGAFYYAIATMYRMRSSEVVLLDPELTRMRPYLMAMIAAYATGILTLSRSYIVLTYMVLGLATAYFQLTRKYAISPLPERRFDLKLARRFALVGVAFVMASYVFVRIFVRWG